MMKVNSYTLWRKEGKNYLLFTPSIHKVYLLTPLAFSIWKNCHDEDQLSFFITQGKISKKNLEDFLHYLKKEGLIIVE
jgi:hypothetical protein